MASEYSVNIRLNTEQVRKDLKDIKKDIDKLGKVNLGTNRKTQKTEAQILDSKRAQQDMMSKTRRIGDLVQKQADQGLKVGRAQEAIQKSALLNQKKDFIGSEKLLKVAMNELKTQKGISKEIAQQAALKTKLSSGAARAAGQSIGRQIASPIGGTRTMMGSPLQLGFAGAGMGRSSLRGNRFQFGSPAFFEAGARAGGASSPLLGTRFDFGSPAQLAFSGGPSLPIGGSRFTPGSPAFFNAAARTGGARSPIGGSRFTFGSPAFNAAQGVGAPRVPIGGRSDLVGSPANLLSIGKQNAMPVKGFESLVGSPAYYEAQNKEMFRIAKMNTLPVKGLKHIVGSPAYFEDQLKKVKKMKGQTGFKADQYGPQLPPMQDVRFPTGRASALNFDSQGNLLPGPAGSRQTRAGLRRTLARNRGPAFQSAAISGAFPLLFGQGPIAAAGGALGGGLGGAFGGQMGGFAGGLIGTAVVSGVQSFVNSIKELGSALDPVSGSASQAVQSLGFLSSARAREIALIEKQIGRQTALAAVRKELADTVGAKQTLALQEAARDINDFQKSIQESLARFRANAASFMADITPGSAVEREMINRGVATDPQSELSKAFLANQAAAQSITGRSLEARIAGFTEASGFLGSGEGRITQAGKAELKRLKAERDIMEVKLRALGIEAKVSSLVKDTNITFMEQLTTRRTAFDLESRVLELRSQGINPAIAKEMAMFEKINSDNVTGLQSEIDLRKEALKTITDETKQQILQDEIAGLEKGLVLLRKQNKERIDAVKKTMELNMRTDLVVSSAQKLKETLVTDIGEGIKGLIRGTSTLNDVLNNVLNKMIDAAFNMALFGNVGGSFMPGLGILGSIFRANGGPVKGGGSYIVGEKGPEVFTPGVSGTITPNHALGGSTNIVVNVDASGSNVEGDEAEGRELGRLISVAVQSEIIKQKRPGGILA